VYFKFYFGPSLLGLLGDTCAVPAAGRYVCSSNIHQSTYYTITNVLPSNSVTSGSPSFCGEGLFSFCVPPGVEVGVEILVFVYQRLGERSICSDES
jgi:hypothetical protein